MSQATTLADGYVTRHEAYFHSTGQQSHKPSDNPSRRKDTPSPHVSALTPTTRASSSTSVCSFCARTDHKADSYWAQRRQTAIAQPVLSVPRMATHGVSPVAPPERNEERSVLLLSTKEHAEPACFVCSQERNCQLPETSAVPKRRSGTCFPYLSNGFISSGGRNKIPVRIMRDSGALQTMVRKGEVEGKQTGEYALLNSVGWRGSVPLLDEHLESNCFSGRALVACFEEFPTRGVDMVPSNDLREDRMGTTPLPRPPFLVPDQPRAQIPTLLPAQAPTLSLVSALTQLSATAPCPVRSSGHCPVRYSAPCPAPYPGVVLAV